ncbi:hypothetical protein QLX67_10110 [Balneolaceae bacterium ANBcel3]|nr:hypothetical protein [Balneolaceae bacterium ANBcel3]
MASEHRFHIPVMGTGHSIDTPIRVAPYGIDSVMSVVDDLLVEKIRKYYAEAYNLPFTSIPRSAEDGRARRITAYLNTVEEVVRTKFDEIRNQPFFTDNEKTKYFEMLPDTAQIKQLWKQLLEMAPSPDRDELEKQITSMMEPGSIDINIMAKVDRLLNDTEGRPLSNEFSDANAAIRGFAKSNLRSSVILSAGFNPRLYGYMAEFRDFYRDTTGELKKKIVLKVSDFRSALIQGKFLAKKGLEIAEFRIESGLNCGGHAFASDGELLPVILKEFKDKKEQLKETFLPMVTSFYETMGWEYPESAKEEQPLVTVQGGIGTYGENQRLFEEYDMDKTGWASPFLLVPEATPIDEPTLEQLKNAGEDDLYLSGASPLGIPFNNLRRSGSERWTKARINTDKPGSPCPKGFLQFNTEFTKDAICTASTQYILLKLDSIQHSDMDEAEKERQKKIVFEKTCLCDHLGNGALIALGILREDRGPQSICPGPNLAWFNRIYTLREMIDHIYGRGKSLVPSHRPHMFAKEMAMYVDYLKDLIQKTDFSDVKAAKQIQRIRKNLEGSIEYCMEIARSKAYADENLSSILETAQKSMDQLAEMFESDPAMA